MQQQQVKAYPEPGLLQHPQRPAQQQQQQQQQQQPQLGSPKAQNTELLRVASVGHDCNLCMWDFPLPPADPQQAPHRLR